MKIYLFIWCFMISGESKQNALPKYNSIMGYKLGTCNVNIWHKDLYMSQNFA